MCCFPNNDNHKQNINQDIMIITIIIIIITIIIIIIVVVTIIIRGKGYWCESIF